MGGDSKQVLDSKTIQTSSELLERDGTALERAANFEILTGTSDIGRGALICNDYARRTPNRQVFVSFENSALTLEFDGNYRFKIADVDFDKITSEEVNAIGDKIRGAFKPVEV